MGEVIKLKDYKINLCLKNIENLFLQAKFNKININLAKDEVKYILENIYDLYLDNNYLYAFNKEMNAYITDSINNLIIDKDDISIDNFIYELIVCHSFLTPEELPLDKFISKTHDVKIKLKDMRRVNYNGER